MEKSFKEKLALTREEAAEQCSVSLPVLDAYLKRSNNPMPCFRAGRRVLIPRKALKKWLEEETARQAGA